MPLPRAWLEAWWGDPVCKGIPGWESALTLAHLPPLGLPQLSSGCSVVVCMGGGDSVGPVL